MNGGAIVTVAKEAGQATQTLVMQNLAKMIARLPPGSFTNAVWIVNNDVLPALFTLTLGNYPIYLPAGQSVGGIRLSLKLDFPALFGPKISVMGLSGMHWVSAKALKFPTRRAWRRRDQVGAGKALHLREGIPQIALASRLMTLLPHPYPYPQAQWQALSLLRADASPVGRVPAESIEQMVLAQVHAALLSPEMVQSVWDVAREKYPALTEPEVVLPLRQMGQVWAQLFPAERQRVVQLLVDRVTLREERIEITWRDTGWHTLAGECDGETPDLAESPANTGAKGRKNPTDKVGLLYGGDGWN